MGCKGGAGVRKSEWEVFGRALKCQQVLWQQGDASAYCAAFIWHIHHTLGPWLWSTSEWCMTIIKCPSSLLLSQPGATRLVLSNFPTAGDLAVSVKSCAVCAPLNLTLCERVHAVRLGGGMGHGFV